MEQEKTNMRQIKASALVSLDGVIGDPHVWANEYFDAAAEEDALQRLDECDAMLMGRHTYEIFARMWPNRSGAYSDAVNAIRKYVFSSTLERAEWRNSTIVRGDVVAEVKRLKEQEGKNLTLYGHGPLGQALLEHGLLDELRLAIHPVVVGRGNLLFRPGAGVKLQLTSERKLATGVVVLTYRRA